MSSFILNNDYDTMSTEKLIKKLIQIHGSNISLEEILAKISDKQTYIDIYTDGASAFIHGKRMEGIGVFFDQNDERNISRVIKSNNNNQAEIIACIEGLKVIKGSYYFVNLYTDSRLVTDAMTSKCTKAKYSDLFDELDKLVDEFVEVNWIYVKGHADTYGNIEADKLSRKCFDDIKV